jgi:type 1 glutamine amidotransferase
MLLAGSMKIADKVGHHDYRAGCALLAFLLEQTSGVQAVAVGNGWPDDERVFDTARALVVYTGGGSKHAFIESAQRIERVQELVEQGVGIVMIHQAVRYPPELASQAMTWIGGAHVPGKSGRGHWQTHHREFPQHAVTRGVRPWKIRDGWLNQIQFVDGMTGVTPLIWSSQRYHGSSEGGAADVVSWTYERPNGGRSFSFTGLDAHSAWSVPGVRQLVVNGILWSAGLPVPEDGAPCAVDDAALNSYLTPRQFRGKRVIWTLLRRLGWVTPRSGVPPCGR